MACISCKFRNDYEKEVTRCQRDTAALMARLRDGEMTTHFSPIFAVEAPSIPSETVIYYAVSTIDAVGTVLGISLGGQQNLHAPQQHGDASPGVTSLTEVFDRMWLIRVHVHSARRGYYDLEVVPVLPEGP
jgi:hypothetical protein